MKIRVIFNLAVILTFLFGCAALLEPPTPVPEKPAVEKPAPKPPVRPLPPLLPVPPQEVPPLTDDMDLVSLEQAVSRSLDYFSRLSGKRTFAFGDRRCSLKEMKESMILFLSIMRSSVTPEEKERRIREVFDFYKASGRGEMRRVLFTGYYEPILEGSFEETEKYRYPVYEVPDDLLIVNLGKFKSKYRGERIVGRIAEHEIVPYYNREDIDDHGQLENKGHEIAWLSDAIDVFFLHIQGSGMIRLSGGGTMQISYAGSNGRPYRSIAKPLLDSGKITENDLSLRSIKAYLRDHPEEMSDILNHNESYVFFRIVAEGPVGSLGVALTGGRSIATDQTLFPRGALSFVRLRKPVFNDKGDIASWIVFSRFVLNQDTGGVIKGPGRVDLFYGRGPEAGMEAGSLKEEGDLYFFVKKKGKKTSP